MSNHKNICLRLCDERKRLKLHQSDIADCCGVNVKTVSRWENSIAIPSNKLLALLNTGMDVIYILTGAKLDPEHTQALIETSMHIDDNGKDNGNGKDKGNGDGAGKNFSTGEPLTEISDEHIAWLKMVDALVYAQPNIVSDLKHILLSYPGTTKS